MHTITDINGHGPGGQPFSEVSPKIQTNNPRFSGRDILHIAVHNPNGFFVMMENNFLSQHSSNVPNEAARYHQAIGSANSDNILLRILVNIEQDHHLVGVSAKIKKLLGLLEFFYQATHVAGTSQTDRDGNTQEIVVLVQQINIECRNLIKD